MPSYMQAACRVVIRLILCLLPLIFFSTDSFAQTAPTASTQQASVAEHTHHLQQLLDQGLRLAGPSVGREETVHAQAMKLRQTLLQNDFGQANILLQQTLSHSRFHAGQFQPFSALLWAAAKPGDGTLGAHLDAWVRAAPDNALPYMLRSVYHYQKGWRIRGTRFTDDVLAQHLQAFHQQLQLAAADAEQALRLAPENPYAHYLPLLMSSGNGMSPDMQRAFAQAQTRFPHYYAVYRLMLNHLAPKWGGSVAKMYAFVDRYVAPSPANSELRLLYVQLFANLLNHAELHCTAPDGKTSEACVGEQMGNLIHAKLLQQVDGALQIYPRVQDKTGYSLLLGHILKNIADQGGTVAEHDADQFIQRAAASMGSNTQLSANHTSRNNFVMDRLTGDIWYRQSRYHDAEKLYRRAIADLQHTDFHNPGQRQTQWARLFLRLANVYYWQHEYEQSAIYQIAAAYMRGGSGKTGYSPTFCGALYHLGLYRQSISACQAQVYDGAGNDALYWMARAHEVLHQIPRAQALYRQLADSESSYRAYAAIQLSVMHAEHHHLQKMLDTLNAYPWLYHQSTDSSRFDIAAAYNNRCYAEMHLGHLHAALADCQASLRYGNLPDAYAKEQEILKRLHLQGNTVSAHGISWGWVYAFLDAFLTYLVIQAISLALSYRLVKWAILRSQSYREQGSPSRVFARIRRWYFIYFIISNSLVFIVPVFSKITHGLSFPASMHWLLNVPMLAWLIFIVTLLLVLHRILRQEKLVKNFRDSLILFSLGGFSFLIIEFGLILSIVLILFQAGFMGVLDPS